MGVNDSKVAVRETAEPGAPTRAHGQGASLRRGLGARFLDTHIHGGMVQRQECAAAAPAPAAGSSHAARLPDSLRTSVERLSGFDMSDVHVHYRSSEPARVQALAYAQGSAIHLGPGQERHLPHEAWHVVQQKQGRVRATSQFFSASRPEVVGVGLNDDVSLEREADRMGAMAARGELASPSTPGVLQSVAAPAAVQQPVQCVKSLEAFKADTYLPMASRDKITAIDMLLEQYHTIGPALPHNVIQKDTLLFELQFACMKYLQADKPGRSEGVNNLLDDIRKDMSVIDPLAEFARLRDPVKKFELMNRSQEAHLLLEREGYLASNHGYSIATFDKFYAVLIDDERGGLGTNPSKIQEVIEGEVEKLEAIRDANNTPELIRNIISEVLSNVSDVNFRSGLPGVRKARADDQIPESYILTHSLRAPGGEAERLGSLLHELTHVSIGETFDNTALLLAFVKGATDDEILELSKKRTTQLMELERLIDTKIFTESQVSLLKNKVKYPIDEIQGNAKRYIGSHQGEIEPTVYTRLVSLAERGMNNSVVEYDTVINQMLLYMYLWKIDPETPFYKMVATLAQEAYDRRLSARTSAP